MVPNSTFLLSSKTAHYSVERVCMHLTIVISTWNISGQLPVCCRLYIYWCRVYTKLVYIINWALLTSKTSFRGAGVVVFINWCSSLVVITGTLGNCLLITPITNRMAAISMLWLGDCVTKSLKKKQGLRTCSDLHDCWFSCDVIILQNKKYQSLWSSSFIM